jgi:hypothetical protein
MSKLIILSVGDTVFFHDLDTGDLSTKTYNSGHGDFTYDFTIKRKLYEGQEKFNSFAPRQLLELFARCFNMIPPYGLERGVKAILCNMKKCAHERPLYDYKKYYTVTKTIVESIRIRAPVIPLPQSENIEIVSSSSSNVYNGKPHGLPPFAVRDRKGKEFDTHNVEGYYYSEIDCTIFSYGCLSMISMMNDCAAYTHRDHAHALLQTKNTFSGELRNRLKVVYKRWVFYFEALVLDRGNESEQAFMLRVLYANSMLLNTINDNMEDIIQDYNEQEQERKEKGEKVPMFLHRVPVDTIYCDFDPMEIIRKYHSHSMTEKALIQTILEGEWIGRETEIPENLVDDIMQLIGAPPIMRELEQVRNLSQLRIGLNQPAVATTPLVNNQMISYGRITQGGALALASDSDSE